MESVLCVIFLVAFRELLLMESFTCGCKMQVIRTTASLDNQGFLLPHDGLSRQNLHSLWAVEDMEVLAPLQIPSRCFSRSRGS